MPSREELFQSIHQDMKLDKAFFLKIYGYEISFPGFMDIAIKALEDAGCSRAMEYYEQITTEYEEKKNEELREVAEWYQKQLDEKLERKVKNFERKEGDKSRKQETIQNLTRDELTELCKRLLQEGIITSPEQFVMVLAEQGQ